MKLLGKKDYFTIIFALYTLFYYKQTLFDYGTLENFSKEQRQHRL